MCHLIPHGRMEAFHKGHCLLLDRSLLHSTHIERQSSPGFQAGDVASPGPWLNQDWRDKQVYFQVNQDGGATLA